MTSYLSVPGRVVVVNTGEHPRAWQEQRDLDISPHDCRRCCTGSRYFLVPHVFRRRIGGSLTIRLFTENPRPSISRKRSTHTRERKRGAIQPDTSNAHVPAAKAILTRPVECGVYKLVCYARWRRYLLAAYQTRLHPRAEGRHISDEQRWAELRKSPDKVYKHFLLTKIKYIYRYKNIYIIIYYYMIALVIVDRKKYGMLTQYM